LFKAIGPCVTMYAGADHFIDKVALT
jgi:hypothetical protein